MDADLYATLKAHHRHARGDKPQRGAGFGVPTEGTGSDEDADTAATHGGTGPGLLAALAGCSSSHVEPPGLEGRPAMINDDGQPRLWVLTKQEEVRQVSVGSTSRSGTGGWRSR